MDTPLPVTSLHGVMMQIHGQGVLITGKAGIGKSGLALELLSQGHQLIADDVVDIQIIDQQLMANCPTMSAGLLHTRELGVLAVQSLFGQNAWVDHYPVHRVVELNDQQLRSISLSGSEDVFVIENIALPRLTLTTNNPASLALRVTTWLKMQQLQRDKTQLQTRQESLMHNNQATPQRGFDINMLTTTN